jgi:hypothetical protein
MISLHTRANGANGINIPGSFWKCRISFKASSIPLLAILPCNSRCNNSELTAWFESALVIPRAFESCGLVPFTSMDWYRCHKAGIWLFLLSRWRVVWCFTTGLWAGAFSCCCTASWGVGRCFATGPQARAVGCCAVGWRVGLILYMVLVVPR